MGLTGIQIFKLLPKTNCKGVRCSNVPGLCDEPRR